MHAQLMLSSHDEYRAYVLTNRRSKKIMQQAIQPLVMALEPIVRHGSCEVRLGHLQPFTTSLSGVQLAALTTLRNKPTSVLFEQKEVNPPVVQLLFADGKITIAIPSIVDVRQQITQSGIMVQIMTTKVNIAVCQI